MKSLAALLLCTFALNAHSMDVPKVCVALGVLAGVTTEMRLQGKTEQEAFRTLLMAERARIEGELDTVEDVSLFVETVWRMNVKQPYTAVATMAAVCAQTHAEVKAQNRSF